MRKRSDVGSASKGSTARTYIDHRVSSRKNSHRRCSLTALVFGVIGWLILLVNGGAATAAEVVAQAASGDHDFPTGMPYRASWIHRTCTVPAIQSKYQYAETVLHQWESPTASGISKGEIDHIFDGQGMCTSHDLKRLLPSHEVLTQYFVTGYLGAYFGAIVNWQNNDYKTCRYFVDDFFGLSYIIDELAKARQWSDWLALDKKFSAEMRLLDHKLSQLGYRSDLPSQLSPH